MAKCHDVSVCLRVVYDCMVGIGAGGYVGGMALSLQASHGRCRADINDARLEGHVCAGWDVGGHGAAVGMEQYGHAKYGARSCGWPSGQARS